MQNLLPYYRKPLAFNRTYLELKSDNHCHPGGAYPAFNRTYLELKCLG